MATFSLLGASAGTAEGAVSEAAPADRYTGSAVGTGQPMDYTKLVRESRKLDPTQTKGTVRLAILSDAASQQFVPLLRVLFHRQGWAADIYEGSFDAIELEAYNPASALYSFQPDAIILANCSQALRARYYREGAAGFVDRETERIAQVWNALQSHANARIIQFNFPAPYDRHFGNYDLLAPDTLPTAATALNAGIAELAKSRSNVFVCDVEAIASYVGRRTWFDERLWHLSKTFCSPEHLPLVAQALVDMTAAAKGRVTKCVVLDLDNTLWGGIVGDDGPLGIAIGPHGDGEPFYHLQQFLLRLKQRGILLAVCSKNNHENAVRPFRENPGMALTLDDITVFVANWEDKAGNICAIRETLDIGLDSMVFLDDNPFERNLVRRMVPGIIVPELPDDPADYVRAICELNLFETSSFSPEDLKRADLYKKEAERREFQRSFSGIGDYLRSLEMELEIARFNQPHLARIAQLIQRSNQFNLATHRYNEAECASLMRDDSCIPLYVNLRDRFGDHGLISVIVLRACGRELAITDWLMSCRVLARGVEQFLMNSVVRLAAERGLSRVTGEYLPTAKNAMVKEFYAQFGFEQVAAAGGHTRWNLEVDAYRPSTAYISERSCTLECLATR